MGLLSLEHNSPKPFLPLVFLFILLGKVLQNAMMPDSYNISKRKANGFHAW